MTFMWAIAMLDLGAGVQIVESRQGAVDLQIGGSDCTAVQEAMLGDPPIGGALGQSVQHVTQRLGPCGSMCLATLDGQTWPGMSAMMRAAGRGAGAVIATLGQSAAESPGGVFRLAACGEQASVI